MCITLLLMIIKRTICANPSLKSFLLLPTVSDFICHYSSPLCCGLDDMQGKCTVKMITGFISRCICFADPQLSAERRNEYKDHHLQCNILQSKVPPKNEIHLITLLSFQTCITCVPEERKSYLKDFK